MSDDRYISQAERWRRQSLGKKVSQTAFWLFILAALGTVAGLILTAGTAATLTVFLVGALVMLVLGAVYIATGNEPSP